jgi:ribonuclease-3
LSGELPADCQALERALVYSFRDPALAALALTHPSHAYESDGSRGNERLEFLGDAVLGLAIAALLFERQPGWSEGELTRARAALVNRRTLAERARALGLRELVRLGRTEERSQGRDKESILANCFEAVVGALYLDGGLAAALPLVVRCFETLLAAGPARRDAKTAFQEWAHAAQRRTPSYHTVGDSGVENDEGRFTVEVRVAGETYGRGVGRTKRAAEAAAAEQGLLRVGEPSSLPGADT